jgi:hypothetical protein
MKIKNTFRRWRNFVHPRIFLNLHLQTKEGSKIIEYEFKERQHTGY